MSRVVQFGHYLLLKKLATGGMAELFLGKQIGLEGFEKPVVIKRILPHLSENEEFITMFLDEARVAARLNHPRVVQIYDLGKEEDSYFIAMEYIRGQDLRKILKRAQLLREPIPLGVLLHLLAGVLEGLDHAHRKTDEHGRPINLVHRDVSPQNILVSYEGDVKIVDFGIAKASTQIYQTRVGILKGKYAYMSPEQARGQAVDRRSDIFAVGILLFEVTTGRRLFRQQSEVDTLKKVIECAVTPPSSVDPDYPKDLEEILLRALQRHPSDRYPWARDMQLAFEDLLRRRGIVFSSTRLAEFMQRLFANEIEQNREEMRVLMEARPGASTPLVDFEKGDSAPRSAPALSPPSSPPPTPPPPSVPSGANSSKGARFADADFQVEPTLLLDDADIVKGEEPEPIPPTAVSPMRVSQANAPTLVTPPPEGMPQPAPSSATVPQRPARSAPAPSSAFAGALLPRAERSPRLILWLSCLLVLGALAGIVWALVSSREEPAAPVPALPSAAPAALPARETAPPAPAPLPTRPGAPALPLRPTPAPAPSPERGREREFPKRRAKKRTEAPAPVLGLATLVVRSTPSTEVYLDGRLLGTTPIETRVDARPGSLRLRNADLGIDHRVGVELRGDARTEIVKAFEKAQLKVSVEPWAQVTLDGRALGETPLAAQSVYEGEHVITLRNPPLRKVETVRVRVRAGETSFVERNWR